MGKFLQIFKLQREERWLAIIVLLAIGVLQYLIISKFWFLFASYSDANWTTFMRNFRMSGFDPITYTEITEWGCHYDILRHPLLPFMVCPLYVVNQLLWWITGCNCVQLVAAVPLVFCSFYSEILLYRIMRHIVEVGQAVATVLSLLFMGFAYIVVAMIVPDHFCISLFLLLLTLYMAGEKMKAGRTFTWQEAGQLFLVTAGVTLSNGVMVFIAVAMTGLKKVLSWQYLLKAFVLPSVLLLGVALATSNVVQPYSVSTADQVNSQFGSTDQKVSKCDIVVENFFGESLQMHRKHVLGDVLIDRPVIVRYSWKAQYAVEAFIVIFFIAGIVIGCRERFGQMVALFFAFNVLLHLLLAFAIREVYIMSAHWTFVIPIAMAYVFSGMKKRKATMLLLFVLLLCIIVYLWVYHGYLLHRYLTWPVKA